MAEDKPLTCTKTQAAKLLRCTLSNINFLVQDGKLALEKPRGKVLIQSVCDHLFSKQERQQNNTKNAENQGKQLEAGARLKNIQARQAELDLKEREGALVDREEVLAATTQSAQSARSMLEALAAQLPIQLLPLDERGMHSLLKNEFRKICDEYSKRLEEASQVDAQ